MSKFVIDESFWDIFPDAEIGVVLAKGIDNTLADTADVRSDIRSLLEQSQREAKKFLTEAVWHENPVIAVWRDAYRQFKTKKGARCSIEALLKRVDTERGIGSINPLVDISNAVSLHYGTAVWGRRPGYVSGESSPDEDAGP